MQSQEQYHFWQTSWDLWGLVCVFVWMSYIFLLANILGFCFCQIERVTCHFLLTVLWNKGTLILVVVVSHQVLDYENSLIVSLIATVTVFAPWNKKTWLHEWWVIMSASPVAVARKQPLCSWSCDILFHCIHTAWYGTWQQNMLSLS